MSTNEELDPAPTQAPTQADLVTVTLSRVDLERAGINPDRALRPGWLGRVVRLAYWVDGYRFRTSAPADRLNEELSIRAANVLRVVLDPDTRAAVLAAYALGVSRAGAIALDAAIARLSSVRFVP